MGSTESRHCDACIKLDGMLCEIDPHLKLALGVMSFSSAHSGAGVEFYRCRTCGRRWVRDLTHAGSGARWKEML